MQFDDGYFILLYMELGWNGEIDHERELRITILSFFWTLSLSKKVLEILKITTFRLQINRRETPILLDLEGRSGEVHRSEIARSFCSPVQKLFRKNQ